MLSLVLLAAFQQGFGATLPITSNGSRGPFNPTLPVVFFTDTGAYQIGATMFSGGRTVIVYSSVSPMPVTVYDFTSINIPSRMSATGSKPLMNRPASKKQIPFSFVCRKPVLRRSDASSRETSLST